MWLSSVWTVLIGCDWRGLEATESVRAPRPSDSEAAARLSAMSDSPTLDEESDGMWCLLISAVVTGQNSSGCEAAARWNLKRNHCIEFIIVMCVCVFFLMSLASLWLAEPLVAYILIHDETGIRSKQLLTNSKPQKLQPSAASADCRGAVEPDSCCSVTLVCVCVCVCVEGGHCYNCCCCCCTRRR